jgi:hypothetical protein
MSIQLKLRRHEPLPAGAYRPVLKGLEDRR